MSSTTDHLANLARPDVGPAVLSLVEDQWFDRKSIRIDAPKLAKTIVALANAEGGVVVVGIHAGRVEGTDALATHRNSLMKSSLDHTEPPARIHSRLIECVNDRGEDDHLLVVIVDTSDVVHATKADECYLRVGDEDRKLRFAQRQELIYDKGQSHFDGTLLADVTVADLDPAAVEAYAAEIGSSASDRALQARALVTSQGAITTAAYLLFGVRPQDRLPEAYVRVLRFEGLERQTGSRLNLRDDIRCEGNLTEMIEAASAQVERLHPHAQHSAARAVSSGKASSPTTLGWRAS